MSNNSINMSISIDGLTEAARGVKELSDEVAKLTGDQRKLLKDKAKLEKANQSNSKAYKELETKIAGVDKELQKSKDSLKENTMNAKATDLTFNQLSTRASKLRNELKNIVQSADPEKWNTLNNKLKETQGQMGTLEGRAQKVQKSMSFKDIAKSVVPTFNILGAVSTAASALSSFALESWDKAKKVQADGIKSMKVFGDELGYVEARASKVAKTAGLTNREFVAMAANTADLLVPIGFTRKEAAKMSVDIQELTGVLTEWSGGGNLRHKMFLNALQKRC